MSQDNVVSVLVKCNSKFFDFIVYFLPQFFSEPYFSALFSVTTMLEMADQTQSTAQLAVCSALAPWWQRGAQGGAGNVKLVNTQKTSTCDIQHTVMPRWPFHGAVRKNYNWDNIYVDDLDQAYDVFLSTFLEFYNKRCPIRTFWVKDKYNGKPWMTKSLQKACKKKNLLHKKYLKLRTSESEDKYKLYKNKLTSIMRLQKKEYYNKILENSKKKQQKNIQQTWKVISHIIWNRYRKE